jgi:group I intron endonuclease
MLYIEQHVTGDEMRSDWPKHGEKCGIYAIENTVNGRVYIGQAKDIRARWDRHRWDLGVGKHPNSHLQRAWKKYGADAFKFLVLEEVAEDNLDRAEQVWMDAFNVTEEGYNQSPTASSNRGVKYSDATRANVAEGLRLALSDPEVRARFSDAAKKRWADPEFRAKNKAASRAYWNSLDSSVKASRMKHLKAASENPEITARAKVKLKETLATPEAKAKKAEAARNQWVDPEIKKRMSAGIKKAWADPEVRERQRRAIRESLADPKVKERKSIAVKAGKRAASKLTEAIVAEIRARYVPRCAINGGKALAEAFGVSPATIAFIVKRKTWV